jgi:hypothetical protein
MEQNKNNQLQQQKEKKYLYYLLMMSTACIIALILLLFLPKSCARNTSSLPEINIDSETGSDSLHSLDDELIYDASFTDVQNPDYSKIE